MRSSENIDGEGITIEIIFGRKILSQIMTTYLPTLLICMVSFSTNYYKSQFFEALVAVNLTSLLVLTTLFISVSNALPKTSYVKMIDIWLIFALLIPYSEVVLHTVIAALRFDDEFKKTSTKVGTLVMDIISRTKQVEAMNKKYRDEKIANFLEYVTKYGIPVIYASFVILYFVAGYVISTLE